jgi:hypothetical protein
VTYDHSESQRLLQRLRDESVASIPEKGLFSSEFQLWHAAAIRVLRDRFGEGASLYQEFIALQFEWPLETLTALRDAHVSSLENPSLEVLNRIAELRDAGERTPPEIARSMAEALRAMASEQDAHAQQRKFQSAMEHAAEILRMAMVFLDQPKNS